MPVVVSFGEIMARISTEGYYTFRQALPQGKSTGAVLLFCTGFSTARYRQKGPAPSGNRQARGPGG